MTSDLQHNIYHYALIFQERNPNLAPRKFNIKVNPYNGSHNGVILASISRADNGGGQETETVTQDARSNPQCESF